MSLLWMGAIAVLAAVLTLWPLWARDGQAAPRRRALNVATYRTRMAEIDVEVEAGTVAADAAQALRDEAAARLLADTAPDEAQAELPPPRRSWLLALFGAALIAAVAGLGYYFGDSRELAHWIAEARRDPAAGQRLAMQSMVQRLQARLQQEPEDAEGWAMLGRSRFVLGEYAEAAEAYARANRLSDAAPRADWLADEAETRIMLQENRSLQGAPRTLFERALAVDAAQPKALWYAGLAAAQAGDYEVALERWLTLRDTELPADFRSVLDARLPELARLAGRELPAPATAVRLALEVAVDPALAAEVRGDDTLFVLARHPDAAGPPLAVRRLRAGDLPLQLTLDDSDAMAPGVNLSSAERWEVVARISRSGTPQAQPGDLEGRVLIEAAQAAQPVALRIDRRLP